MVTRVSLISGLVNRDRWEVNLPTPTSSTHLVSLGIEVSLLPLVNLLSLTVLPGPIPYAFHVVIQSSPYSTFDTPLAPSNLIIADVLGFANFTQCDVKTVYTSRRSHSVNHLRSILNVVTPIEVNSHMGHNGCRLPVACTFSSLWA